MFEEKAASQAEMQEECDAMINEETTAKSASRQNNTWRSCTCGLQLMIWCHTKKVSIDCDEIFQCLASTMHCSWIQSLWAFESTFRNKECKRLVHVLVPLSWHL
jgi:hypothetical protein